MGAGLPLLSWIVWALAIAIAVVANVLALLGVIEPFAALMASVPFMLLAIRAIDSAGNPPSSGIDGAHQPALIDNRSCGAPPSGPSF